MIQTTINFPIHTRENNALSESFLHRDTPRLSKQCEAILSHLMQHGSITTWEAIQQYGITRLSGRIFDLRKAGYKIITTGSGKNAVFKLDSGL